MYDSSIKLGGAEMKEPKINIGNSQKERIVTKELKINGNVFIYNETIIPLNNISRICIADAPKEQYPILAMVLLAVGVLCFLSKSLLGVIIGLAIGGVGAWFIYSTYKRNQEIGEFLVLNLNSGRDIYLYSKDHEFTVQIMDVIINCINAGKEYKINMQNCHIEACQFGEKNMMTRGK